MEKKRVLFISQQICPYLPENELSLKSRTLSQGTMEGGKDIRIFMPKYGCINERRYQLHEVIRLSGMNMILDNLDYPLIIKVASLQPIRMQVYFIENEDYYPKKSFMEEADGEVIDFHDERTIFFCRGVLETVRKLGWAPDVVHCHGWMSALVPLYLKRAFKDDPIFADTKVVYSVYAQDERDNELIISDDLARKSIVNGIEESDVELIGNPKIDNLHKIGMKFADAIILGNATVSDDLTTYAESLEKTLLPYQTEENCVEAYNLLYDQLLEEEIVLT